MVITLKSKSRTSRMGSTGSGFAHLHKMSERFTVGQCMLGRIRAEVIFYLIGAFICCLGEDCGRFLISLAPA